VPETGTVPEIEAVTLPICAVPAPRVTEPEMGIGFPAETAEPEPVPIRILDGIGFDAEIGFDAIYTSTGK
jgi:hypothetical protein